MAEPDPPTLYPIPGTSAGNNRSRFDRDALLSNMASGTVKFFNSEKGFGFITPDSGERDVFVHKTGTKSQLFEGDKVTYEVEETPKGLNAINVEKA